MSRRQRWKPQPPPGLRPKLSRSQVLSAKLIHLQNVQTIADGSATRQTLYDHAHATLVWLTLARDYQARYGTIEEALRAMEAAQAACGDLVERWRRTGRVVFTGPELQMAREAIGWMDALAELVDEVDADAAGRSAVKALTEVSPDLVASEAQLT